MLEVEVDRCTRGARDEAVHSALDAVRAEHDVRLRGRAVGKVDRRRTQGRLGEVGTALAGVRARGVDEVSRKTARWTPWATLSFASY